MSDYKLTHLKELESESIYILREVAAQFEKPALLFSGGKDSIVMAYLAYKAFIRLPFLFHLFTSIPDIISKKLFHTEIIW